MRVIFLIFFAGAMTIVALDGCSAREEHGLDLRWSDG
jgi:hypothetical protein